MMNISDWIQERSFLQPHKKALIFGEPPETAGGKIQKFILKETLGITKFQAANHR
jgi:hypothetical protein